MCWKAVAYISKDMMMMMILCQTASKISFASAAYNFDLSSLFDFRMTKD